MNTWLNDVLFCGRTHWRNITAVCAYLMNTCLNDVLFCDRTHWRDIRAAVHLADERQSVSSSQCLCHQPLPQRPGKPGDWDWWDAMQKFLHRPEHWFVLLVLFHHCAVAEPCFIVTQKDWSLVLFVKMICFLFRVVSEGFTKLDTFGCLCICWISGFLLSALPYHLSSCIPAADVLITAHWIFRKNGG